MIVTETDYSLALYGIESPDFLQKLATPVPLHEVLPKTQELVHELGMSARHLAWIPTQKKKANI